MLINDELNAHLLILNVLLEDMIVQAYTQKNDRKDILSIFNPNDRSTFLVVLLLIVNIRIPFYIFIDFKRNFAMLYGKIHYFFNSTKGSV